MVKFVTNLIFLIAMIVAGSYVEPSLDKFVVVMCCVVANLAGYFESLFSKQ